ncbi:29996_t:CDS:2 [Racocetra persica]|uniref:29996_t:CDS:1 n=1 Tax=Racocetra persica TaxID=160502 RepID=A0ACA9KGY1_9GLOM|nr:29996_t:CDS:2 [Racocetra persica]
MATYADVVKENLEANVITNNTRSRNIQPFQVEFEDQKTENHDATLFGSKPEVQDEPRKGARGQGRKRKRKSKEKNNGEMSQMPEGDDEYGYDPMNMDEYDDGQLDGTAGPSYNPQSSYGIREAGGYDEGFFSGPVHQQHHKGGSHHHRQNQQSDKTVDQDFFNDFPDDFDDEDLK